MSVFSKLKNYFLSTRQFDDNSRIEFLHRFAIRYVEGHKSVDIGFDPRDISFGNTSRAIITQTIDKWNDPFSSELISKEKKRDIINKIIIYCKEKRIKYTIE